MRKLNFWVPLRELKWHTPVCPSIHLPPPPPPTENLYHFCVKKWHNTNISRECLSKVKSYLSPGEVCKICHIFTLRVNSVMIDQNYRDLHFDLDFTFWAQKGEGVQENPLSNHQRYSFKKLYPDSFYLLEKWL